MSKFVINDMEKFIGDIRNYNYCKKYDQKVNKRFIPKQRVKVHNWLMP